MAAAVATSLEVAANAFEKSREKLVNAYIRQARSAWDVLTPSDLWNDAVTYGVAARMAMLELSMLAQIRRLAISYADETLRQIGVNPSGSMPGFTYPRVNTDPWLVAQRPADSYRSAAVKSPNIRPIEWPSANDKAYAEVSKWINSLHTRLETVVNENVERTATSTTIGRYRRCKVLQYRRVLHPELSKGGSCGLCIVAADRWYSTMQLLPLHANCKCGVAPAGDDSDPGFQLNQKDLQNLYSEAGGNTADRLKSVRVQTITNGELGPVLLDSEARDTPNPVPDKDSQAWHTPDRKVLRSQYEAMKDRALEFSKRYKQVSDTHKSVTFTYDGRTYTFKPSKHLKNAWANQRTLLNQVQSLL